MSDRHAKYESDVALLKAADLFYPDDPEEPEFAGKLILNMNDVWGWATGWGEEVPADQVHELARLFRDYGWPGVLYWMSGRHDNMRSEFEDINRFVDFVRNEEKIRADVPNSSKRAYVKAVYTLGAAVDVGNVVPRTK